MRLLKKYLSKMPIKNIPVPGTRYDYIPGTRYQVINQITAETNNIINNAWQNPQRQHSHCRRNRSSPNKWEINMRHRLHYLCSTRNHPNQRCQRTNTLLPSTVQACSLAVHTQQINAVIYSKIVSPRPTANSEKAKVKNNRRAESQVGRFRNT